MDAPRNDTTASDKLMITQPDGSTEMLEATQEAIEANPETAGMAVQVRQFVDGSIQFTGNSLVETPATKNSDNGAGQTRQKGGCEGLEGRRQGLQGAR